MAKEKISFFEAKKRIENTDSYQFPGLPSNHSFAEIIKLRNEHTIMLGRLNTFQEFIKTLINKVTTNTAAGNSELILTDLTKTICDFEIKNANKAGILERQNYDKNERKSTTS